MTPGGARLLVAEPTFRGGDHAPVNAALLQALTLAAGPAILATTRRQRDAIAEADPAALAAATWHEIEVMEAGGVKLRRILAQWRTLSALVAAYRPAVLVLLSTGPETLFAARALALRHRGLRLFLVLHGVLADAIGWRSRDPRRRLIDLRSGLRVARHPRIRLVVLEEHIRAAALRHRLGAAFLVWPHTVLEAEAAAPSHWAAPPRLRIAWVGSANRQKGFDDFLALHRSCATRYAWSVAGRASAEYEATALAGLDVPDTWLDRATLLSRVRAADYAFVALRDEYELTASGSLLDCINQRKPILAVRSTMLEGLAQRYGPIGHLCDDLAGVQRLLEDGTALRDAPSYARFQAALDAIARDRLPAALARTIGRDMA